jgi:hypothetical protein
VDTGGTGLTAEAPGTRTGREQRRTGLGLKITEARLGPSSVDGPNANAANLEPGTRIALAGLNAAAMNGKRGVVKGPDVNNGARVNVVLDGGQTFSVKPENCVVVR